MKLCKSETLGGVEEYYPLPDSEVDAIVKRLKNLAVRFEGDVENIHLHADNMLLDLIGDPRITNAFDSLPKWYA